jgi:hypothetical protein
MFEKAQRQEVTQLTQTTNNGLHSGTDKAPAQRTVNLTTALDWRAPYLDSFTGAYTVGDVAVYEFGGEVHCGGQPIDHLHGVEAHVQIDQDGKVAAHRRSLVTGLSTGTLADSGRIHKHVQIDQDGKVAAHRRSLVVESSRGTLAHSGRLQSSGYSQGEQNVRVESASQVMKLHTDSLACSG